MISCYLQRLSTICQRFNVILAAFLKAPTLLIISMQNPTQKIYWCTCRAHCGGLPKPVSLSTYNRHAPDRQEDQSSPEFLAFLRAHHVNKITKTSNPRKRPRRGDCNPSSSSLHMGTDHEDPVSLLDCYI